MRLWGLGLRFLGEGGGGAGFKGGYVVVRPGEAKAEGRVLGVLQDNAGSAGPDKEHERDGLRIPKPSAVSPFRGFCEAIVREVERPNLGPQDFDLIRVRKPRLSLYPYLGIYGPK